VALAALAPFGILIL